MPRPCDVTLRTCDGVRLAATLWRPTSSDVELVGAGLACVVAHGFTGSSRNAHVQRICRVLATRGITVLAPDFRGHGRSAGRGTAGAEEIHDVAAAVAWLRDRGHRRVAVVGWSMGGSAVLRHAGLGGDADAVVSVSAPGHWFERGTRSMRLVHWMFEKRTGRVATRILRGTRLSAAVWSVVPESPEEVVGAIAPTPLLIVHGAQDHYFPLAHVEELSAAAPDATVWIEPDMGHAEVATNAELLDRIGDWLLETSGSTPPAVCDDVTRE